MNNVRWLALLLLSTAALADEGMWLAQYVPDLSPELTAKGLSNDEKKIAKLTEFPLNTVVNLAGCSGSFVSATGLIITNQHCFNRSIQHHSSNNKNLQQTGFLATTLQQELPAAPGSKVLLTQQLEDVTRQIRQELTPQLTGQDRVEKIAQLRKELIADCETTAAVRCTLYSYDGGLAYYLLKQLEITDIRLVYVPTTDVGQFGAGKAQLPWPRHSADFALFRAYVGKDGMPRPYQYDNVPFVPPAFLKISAKGVQAQDQLMVLGYPGQSYRHLTAAELKLQFNQILPLQQQYRLEIIRLIRGQSTEKSAESLRYQSRLAALEASSKNTSMLLEAYQSSALQQRKEQQQQALIQWIKAEPGRQAKFLPALLDLEMLVQQQSTHLQRHTLLQAFNAVQLFSAARQLYRNAQEQLKPDSEREVGFQQRDQANLTAVLNELHNTMSPQVEIDIAWFLLQQYHQLPDAERVPLLDQFFQLSAGSTLDQPALLQLKQQLQQMYQQTKLTDAATLLKWQHQPVEAFQQSQDPLLQLAVALYPAELAREQQQKNNAGKMLQLKPLVMSALQAFKTSQQQKLYPDANGSLRLSVGAVQGYQPRDGIYYRPFTTVAGIAEKAAAGSGFVAPTAQLNAIATASSSGYAADRLGTVPLNFLSTADTTTDNAGAATLNAQAELVGLLLAGVSDGLIADYDYNPATTRAIHVDSRYMLWQMDKVDGASQLVQEMVIVR